MSERSSKSQRVQFGWESAYGTAATAVRKLLSMTFDPDIQATRKRNFAQGYNFPSSTSLERDFTEADMGGAAMFDEVIVPLMLAFGVVTPTALTPVTAMQWKWTIPLSGDITPRSATFEKGDANTGERVPGVIATDISMNWTRDEVNISASAFGQLTDVAATMASAGVTSYPQVPVNPSGIGVWLDISSAALGTTRMLRVFEGDVSFGGLQGQVWPLNDSKDSFDGFVGLQPDSESSMTLAANAAGKALIGNLRAGDRRYMRTAFKGPQIGAGPATYLIQLDQAVEVVDVGSFEDSDGIYAYPVTLAPVADETWGKAVEITVVNTMTAATA